MREYDLVIRGGTIVDGTGVPRYKADLAVKSGRVAKISGVIKAGAGKEIDASGCIVAPGVLDLHTHYEAQLNWDPYASLSGWFGVTSVTVGQCGFGFAPTKPQDRDLNMRMMNRIEAIPLESMRQGMRWDWITFPEFLNSLEHHGLGINVGSLFPFSPLRGYVLGMMEARERTSVTESELNQMKQIFYEAMQAGAFGFSADKNMEDRPEDGGYLPSHVASDEEFLAMAEVLGEFGVGHIGWTIFMSQDPGHERQLMKQMMDLSGRPLQVAPEEGSDSEVWVRAMREQGYPVLSQEFAMTDSSAHFTLAEYNLFDYMPNWVQPFVGTPEERAAKLRDSDARVAMKRDVTERPHHRTDWATVKVEEVVHERNYKYEGYSIRDIAKMDNKDGLDAFLDLALDEDLKTTFSHQLADPARRERIQDPFGHVSVSDGGAHTRFLAQSTWPVDFLSHWIRDKEIMTLEEAHYKISSLPAWMSDFKDRGMLRVGNWADIIVYNQEELGVLYDKPTFANDFPGGERRRIQKPKGLRYTIVNGGVTFEENNCTGSLPGKLLRSCDVVS